MSTTYLDPHAVTAPAVRPVDGARPRVSWSAIFAGVFVVVAIELLLNLLGAAIGLGMVHPGSAATPDAATAGTNAGIWMFVSTVIAFVASGYVAARLAGVPSHFDGLLHGLVIWSVTILFTVYLLSTAVGSLIGGTAAAVGGIAAMAGEGVKQAAPKVAQAAGVTPDMVQQQAQGFLRPAPQDPAAMTADEAQKAIAQAVPNLAKGGDDAAQAKQRIVAIMAAQQHVGQDQAQQQFEQAQQKFEQAKQQAVDAAKRAADESAAAASKASYLAVIALVIGALAACFGGVLATPRRGVLAA